jgi:hypothetical protein
MAQSGGIVPFYAVIIHDKCKTASHDTLRAYKAVAEDLLKDAHSGYKDSQDLKDAIKACDHALAGKK